MSSLKKAEGRDRKRSKRSKMSVDNRGIFVVQEQMIKKAEKAKSKGKKKNKKKIEDNLNGID
jgi:hypothetical protein